MNCISCKNKSFFNLLDLNKLPMVNNFSKSKEISSKRYDLKLTVCSNCKLIQLKKHVSPKKLFLKYKHYSAASSSQVKHLKDVSGLIKINRINKTKILEIGSNDNTMLNFLKDKFFFLCAVDPSAKKNLSNTNAVIKDFFSYKLSKIIKKKYGEFDYVVGINVIPHVSQLNDVLKGVSNLLKPNGKFIVEGVYLYNNINKGLFDTFYHEHVSSFSIYSLEKALNLCSMGVIKTSLLKTQGGSFRAICSHLNSKYAKHISVKKILTNEKAKGVASKFNYNLIQKNLSKKISLLKIKLDKLINNKIKNKMIIGLGAPARGVVMVNVLNLNKSIRFYIDDSKTKQNCYFPGTSSKVINWKNKNIPNCKYFILLSWNYRNDMINKLYKINNQFYLISLFPKFKIEFFA